MPSFIEPNIHPVLVHFAYALSVTGALSLLIAALGPQGGWRGNLKIAGDWMLALGALAIIATVAAGFQAYYSVDHDAPSHLAMTTHRNWAVTSALAFLVLAAWRWKTRQQRPSVLFGALLLAAALSLSVTAWWGGKIVYGYGLGVASLPSVTGDGHDHDHGGAQHHDEPATHDDSDGHHDHDKSASLVQSGSSASPEDVVNAFGAAMRNKDAEALQALLLPDVVIAEGGGAERSLAEYGGHHMPADMAFVSAIKTTLKSRDIIEVGDMATIISEQQMHGSYKGKTVHRKMMETMVLRRTDGVWRIAHIHWSSAPITGDHEH